MRVGTLDPKKFWQDNDLDITRKGIIKAIKEKQEHPNGGTFDNWITLYVAKAVSDMESDDDILYQLDTVASYSDKASKPYYFEEKTGKTQSWVGKLQGGKFAWMEAYNKRYPNEKIK